MTNPPARVSPGTPVRAADINAIADAARAATTWPAAGDTAVTSPFGRSGPVLRRPSPQPFWPSMPQPLPWTPRLYRAESDAWHLEITRVGYIRGPVTVLLADLDFELPDPPATGDGDYWVGVKIDTETGSVDPTLLCSQTAAEVFDITPPTDKYYKRLLYSCSYVAADAEAETLSSWAIKKGWYRLLPELGAYL